MTGADRVAPATLLAVLVAALVAVREAFSLPVLPMLAAAVVVVAVLGVATCRGLDELGFGLLALGVTTSSWNGVSLGPLKLTHMAFALAGLLLGVAVVVGHRSVHAPGWVWGLGATIGVVTVLSLLWPPDRVAYASRYDAGLGTVAVDDLAVGNIAASLQWLIAALVVPVVVCVAVQDRPVRLRRLADAWVVGATVNAAVAVGDELGITRISALFLAEVDTGGRQAALTVQPNHAALAIAMALPVALWRAGSTREPTTRAAALAAMVVMAAGLATTGSRAGLVAAALGVVAVAVVDRHLRRYVPVGAALGLAAAVLLVAAVPQLLGGVGQRLRLVNGLGADASDAIRVRLAEQAVDDIGRSPLHGLGFQVMDQAHNIYLQLLASGGVILLVGYLAAQLGFVVDAWGLRDRERGLAAALAVSGGTLFVAGVVSNQLTDVFAAIPFAMVAGMWATTKEPRAREPVRPRVPAAIPVKEIRS